MLIQRFAQQIKKTPAHIAVKTGKRTYTYTELNGYANRIAHLVKAANKGEIVGLLFEHGVHMIAAILGALKAGKIYVPLSTYYPPDRLSYMLSDSRASLILTNTQNQSLAQSLAQENHIPLVIIDSAEPETSSLSAENPGRTVYRDKPAYILYTSGSTGRPKGVVQTHENADYYNRNWVKIFSITSADRMTLFSSFCHDGSAQDMYSALYSGAALYPFNMRNPDTDMELSEFLTREKITIWHSVPSLFSSFASTLTGREKFPYLRFILLGGEPVRKHEVRMLNDYFPYSTLANVYGQTESSVNTIRLIPHGSKYKRPLLGTPLDETRVLVIDEEGDPVETFSSGEILVNSPYISPGYWKNPKAGEEVFGQDEELGKLYWTGDMGRLLVDGNIEFLGRRDYQVKIRGFRVELGEIESRLLEHHLVKEAVVTIREDKTGDKYPCAYITAERKTHGTAREEIDISELREYLSSKLPDYMIPSYFVLLENMPQTPGGKIDRKSLPAPEIHQDKQNYVPPRHEIEKKLVKIWSDVLGIKEKLIGIDDDFFQLGGHSLRATIMAAKIHKLMGINIPLLIIFKTPRIRELAQYVQEAGEKEKSTYQSIESVEKKEYYVLSSAQKRLFLLQEKDKNSTGYNMPSVSRLKGLLDKQKVEHAFLELIQKHESLRTRFLMINTQPVQVIDEAVDFKIDYIHLAAGTAGSEEKAIRSFFKPFDLSQASLVRVRLIEVEKDNHILIVDMHHIIADGVSLFLLIKDFMAVYGGEELPALPLQYKDYSEWQNRHKSSETLKKQEAHWLKSFEAKIPLLDLPTDFQRPHLQRFEGSMVSFEISREELCALKYLAAKEEVTLFILLLAITNILLLKLTGNEDIVVGVAVAGRKHTDIQQIIGMFVNTLVLRNYPTGGKKFKDFLKETRERTLEAFENQDYQFEDLVEQVVAKRDESRNPLFDVMLILQNMEVYNIEIPGLELQPYEFIRERAKLDLNLQGYESREQLNFILEYSINLFRKETIDKFVSYFKSIVSEIIRNPERELYEIKKAISVKKQELLARFIDDSDDILN